MGPSNDAITASTLWHGTCTVMVW